MTLVEKHANRAGTLSLGKGLESLARLKVESYERAIGLDRAKEMTPASQADTPKPRRDEVCKNAGAANPPVKTRTPDATVDVSPELAVEHRTARKEEISAALEAMLAVPKEPTRTYALRVTLAGVKSAPSIAIGQLANAARAQRRFELATAMRSVALGLRCARFQCALESALEVADRLATEGGRAGE